MAIDPSAETDPRLRELSVRKVYDLYVATFEGFRLCETLKKSAQATDDKGLAPEIEKAIKQALVELNLLVTALGERKKARKGAWKPATASEVLDDLKQRGFASSQLLSHLHTKLETGWPAVGDPLRGQVIEELVFTRGERGPDWPELLVVLGELEGMNRTADGEGLQPSWYESLLERARAVKKQGDRTRRSVPPRARPTPPPDEHISDYSPKATFVVGQWVRHPKFGVGYVVDTNDGCSISFEDGIRRLAHVAGVVTPFVPDAAKPRRSDPDDILARARASGIEITKLPPGPPPEDKK
jgi:hypothetical protein